MAAARPPVPARDPGLRLVEPGDVLLVRKALAAKTHDCFVQFAEPTAGRLEGDATVVLRDLALLALGKHASKYVTADPPARIWLPAGRDELRRLLLPAISFDLAYRTYRDIESPAALDVLARFVALFGPSAAFFVNFEPGADGLPASWTPVTQATFDAALGGVEEGRVGLLVLTGED